MNTGFTQYLARLILRLCQWLARTLGESKGAESLRGDLDESIDRSTNATLRASLAHLRDTLSTTIYWWRPATRAARGRAAAPIKPRESAMYNALEDVHSGLRILFRRRGFKSAVLLTLGLGIGATTTIFSVVDTVLLRPLPYAAADRLMALGTTFPDQPWRKDAAGLRRLAGVSVRNFADWRERATSFDHLAALESRGALLPDVGRGLEIGSAASVTAGFLELLSVKMHLGRSFLAEDFEANAPPVRLLSYSIWRDRYGADSSILGEPGQAGAAEVVVGVLAPDFKLPEAIRNETPDIWWPLKEGSPRYLNRGMRSLFVLGRLAPHATLETAREEMDVLAVELAEEFPDGNVIHDGRAFGVGVNGLKAQTIGGAARLLGLFFGAAGLLMLVALLNSTNLMLVRALARRREFEVRQALGAGRARLSLLLITESVTLALCGGLIGVGLARLGVGAFVRLSPQSMPRLAEVALDVRVVSLALLMSSLLGLLVGVLASWGLGTGLSLEGLRSRAQAVAAPSQLRSGLVVCQLAIAVMLLVGASLLMVSFLNVASFDPGFEPKGLWTFSAPLKSGPQDVGNLWRRWDAMLEAVGSVPAAGVTQVAASSNLPFQDPNWAPAILLEGQSFEEMTTGTAGYVITPNFPEVARIPLLRGRGLSAADSSGSAQVALVNETFATQHFGNIDVVGERLRLSRDDDRLDTVEIVGVLGNVVHNRVEDGYQPAIYRPYTQEDWPRAWITFRRDEDGAGMGMATQGLSLSTATTDAVREAAATISPIAPAADLAPLNSRIQRTRAEPLFRTTLLVSFSLVATILAVLGLYGTLSHLVSRRRKEIGIRIALGAHTRGVMTLVASRGALLTGAGLVLGLLGSWVTTRLLSAYLFGVESMSPEALAIGVGALALASMTATLLPARRAALTDPAENLRAE